MDFLSWPILATLWVCIGLLTAFVYKLIFVRESLWKPVEGYMFAALIGPLLLLIIIIDHTFKHFGIDL